MNQKLLLATALVATTTVATAKPQQPNVIMIMCDDLGWGDVGFNGNTTIKTPHLDQMAEDGIKFNRFYAACAVSSPTRASCLTGRNPFRTGVFNANAGILRPEEITIPELLRDKGYKSGHFGKWHLGTLTHTERDANRGKVGNVKEYNPPKEHGYDVAFVTESKVPTWNPMCEPGSQNSYGTSYWDIDGNKVSGNLEGDDSRVIMDRVLPFIEQSKADKDPFLAVVWFHTPHKPCVAGKEYAAMYEGHSEDFKNYAGCITAMDEQVGRLRDYLKKSGLDKNTMVWFCSDNGPENCKPNGGGVTGGLKARKRSLYEGGVRVPACMVWGNNVKSGVVSEMVASTNDYLPTIAAAAKVDPAAMKNELDGIDLTPMLEGRVSVREKAVVAAYKGQISYTAQQYKLYYKVGGAKEYYDITNDPAEKNPIQPTPEVESYFKPMMAVVDRYRMSFECGEYGKESFDKLGQSWDKNSGIVKPQTPTTNKAKKSKKK